LGLTPHVPAVARTKFLDGEGKSKREGSEKMLLELELGYFKDGTWETCRDKGRTTASSASFEVNSSTTSSYISTSLWRLAKAW
jgi:hypothetical protein